MEYCELNEHGVGIAMKEMARRAIVAIRRERFTFEATRKDNPYKTSADFFSSADIAAQQIYVRTIQECFPKFGIVAEENGLRLLCHHPLLNAFLTVDPLDGTNAYIRRQSHGIGTMVALVINGNVVAACVGDVMTQEMYYFRPESDKVHRVSEFDHTETLKIDADKPLGEQYMLLGNDPRIYSPVVQRLTAPNTGAFKGIEVSGGSIGLRAARLWKGEVGAMVLHPGTEMPWDIVPVMGISEKMGFEFWAIRSDGTFGLFAFTPTDQPQQWDFGLLIVHTSRHAEIAETLERFR
jgi:fructose-1,6-bisphosphatase/inositol monophosphatase family enzyme